jgi:hypothetical protein
MNPFTLIHNMSRRSQARDLASFTSESVPWTHVRITSRTHGDQKMATDFCLAIVESESEAPTMHNLGDDSFFDV